MHIALDVHDMNRTGGLEKVVMGIATEMARRGHQVSCFTYAAPLRSPTPPLPDGLRLEYYSFTGDAAIVRPMRDRLLRSNPDVFISPSSFNNILFWSAVLRSTGIPLLYSEHNNPWRIEQERWNPEERRAVLWAADAVHLLMPQFLDSVPTALRSKCRIIANPVPAPPVIPSQKHTPYILSLGRLAAVKQIPMLVRAFALLAAEFPRWELHIWGIGSDEKNIRKAIAATRCASRIFLHGMTRQPAQQFAQADIFCIPSRFEGLPLTVVEAFSHGVPVVGFADCSGVNGLVRPNQNGLLAVEMTDTSLAASLRHLMADATARQYMGQAAQKDAQLFSPAIIYDQWERLLYETAASKGQTQLQKMDVCSPMSSLDEESWCNTMRKLCARKNLLLRDSQLLRRIIWRHPRLKALLKRLLQKA